MLTMMTVTVQLRVTQGAGQFVSMPCGSEFVFGRLWEREKVRAASFFSVVSAV